MLKLISCFSYLLLFSESTHENSQKPKTVQLSYKYGVMSYSCSAEGQKGDYLSWYQIKGSERVLLRRIQPLNNTSHKMKVNLTKTLQLSDKGTELYCAKQRDIPGGGLSEGIESEKIPVNFAVSSIKDLNPPYVTVSPNVSSVAYDVNATLTFACNGSEPVDQRDWTWYIQKSDSELELAKKQTFNRTTNITTLILYMNESYHNTQLYCAQNFYLRYQRLDGTFGIDTFNELKRSGVITLRERGKEESIADEGHIKEESYVVNDDGTTKPKNILMLALALPLGVVMVLAILLAVVWVRCRRRRNPQPTTKENDDDTTKENDDDCTYATAQVTYAVLDLQSPTTEYATPADVTYAKIIGVYEPKPK